MPNSNHIENLRDYENELDAILSRFTHADKGIWINSEDKPRYEQIVLELRDYYHDLFGENNYGPTTINAYYEGINNFYKSPSFNSVQRVKSVLSASIKRVERNPEVLSSKDNPSSFVNPEILYPKKITAEWLLSNVPMGMWLAMAGAFVAVFILGATATAKLSLFQDWFGITIK